VLPSAEMRVLDSGVFWPTQTSSDAALATASDHHLVWIDVIPAL
jgi:hypothetical protein